MFAQLTALPDDPILRLSRLFAEDPRPHKIDVGVGIYQNAQGETPVMRAVKIAEEKVWQTQRSKKYLGLSGNSAFNDAMRDVILGDVVDKARVRAQQSVAGTGALSLIANALHAANPDVQVWIPDPTWGNHYPIFAAAGLQGKPYPYYDVEHACLRREALFAALGALGPGDVVLLHGCCHNPSGADPSREDWQEIARLAVERGFLPVIDLAYTGFGAGIEEDLFGVRHLAQTLPELLVAVSCSKNFGLYRDRAGIVLAVAENATVADALLSQLNAVSRSLISMPADHGAAVVATILGDEPLRQMWRDELAEMSASIRQRRAQLHAALQEALDGDWSFITRQHGMFSLLPLGEARVTRLREEAGVYIVGSGRINFAGLHSEEDSVALAQAIATVMA